LNSYPGGFILIGQFDDIKQLHSRIQFIKKDTNLKKDQLGALISSGNLVDKNNFRHITNAN